MELFFLGSQVLMYPVTIIYIYNKVLCRTSPARVIAARVCSAYVITTNIPTLITLQLILRAT